MKYMYSVENIGEFKHYQSFINENSKNLQDYINYLKSNYKVYELPKYLLLSNMEIATNALSDIPIPAYTNDIRIVFTPEINIWREIYKRQLINYGNDEQINEIKTYYNDISENYLLQVIGHELMHHSDLFLDDFDNINYEEIWFEEGMCEYISKKYFFTKEEFVLDKEINLKLIELFEKNNDRQSINNWDITDEKDYSKIFYNYWKSFIVIDNLVDKLGSIENVFEKYNNWGLSDRKIPLKEWLEI